jgi:ribosomal protein L29
MADVKAMPSLNTVDDARRARLRALAELTPDERVKRLESLNQQLFALRADAAAARASNG